MISIGHVAEHCRKGKDNHIPLHFILDSLFHAQLWIHKHAQKANSDACKDLLWKKDPSLPVDFTLSHRQLLPIKVISPLTS